MSRIFIFAMFVKALLLALGILAWHGCHWAFILFLGVGALSIITNILMAVVANSADKDIEREDL